MLPHCQGDRVNLADGKRARIPLGFLAVWDLFLLFPLGKRARRKNVTGSLAQPRWFPAGMFPLASPPRLPACGCSRSPGSAREAKMGSGRLVYVRSLKKRSTAGDPDPSTHHGTAPAQGACSTSPVS